jgi:uncharacterized membrane protein SpoIIM required for sporulation
LILDLARFLQTERPYWDELNSLLDQIENDRFVTLSLHQLTRLEYLYQRAASALARLSTFSAEPNSREFLESLVARAYAECHPNRAAAQRFQPLHWFFSTFPKTFRRHARAFALAVALTIAGAAFGWSVVAADNDAKRTIMPFPGLMQSPAERVKQEESAKTDRLSGHKGTFSAQLMTNNIKVSLLTFALGATWGIGTTILLFYNGVILGAVAVDYVYGGQVQFLLGWLLPHGVIEIPAILIAGQAGFVLASALIGWGNSSMPDLSTRRTRLRTVLPDVLTLAGGLTVMLVWAGIIEAFISQYHYPVLPYSWKIAFGVLELAGLTLFLSRAGGA